MALLTQPLAAPPREKRVAERHGLGSIIPPRPKKRDGAGESQVRLSRFLKVNCLDRAIEQTPLPFEPQPSGSISTRRIRFPFDISRRYTAPRCILRLSEKFNML